MTAAACMGGFCPKRENCARYQQANRSLPVERLCERGQLDAYAPLAKVIPIAQGAA